MAPKKATKKVSKKKVMFEAPPVVLTKYSHIPFPGDQPLEARNYSLPPFPATNQYDWKYIPDTEGPWALLSGLNLVDNKPIRRIMSMINDLVDNKNKNTTQPQFSARRLHRTERAAVYRALKETKGNYLLYHMLAWFGSHWDKSKEEVRLAVEILHMKATIFVRRREQHMGNYHDAKEEWKTFLGRSWKEYMDLWPVRRAKHIAWLYKEAEKRMEREDLVTLMVNENAGEDLYSTQYHIHKENWATFIGTPWEYNKDPEIGLDDPELYALDSGVDFRELKALRLQSLEIHHISPKLLQDDEGWETENDTAVEDPGIPQKPENRDMFREGPRSKGWTRSGKVSGGEVWQELNVPEVADFPGLRKQAGQGRASARQVSGDTTIEEPMSSPEEESTPRKTRTPVKKRKATVVSEPSGSSESSDSEESDFTVTKSRSRKTKVKPARKKTKVAAKRKPPSNAKVTRANEKPSEPGELREPSEHCDDSELGKAEESDTATVKRFSKYKKLSHEKPISNEKVTISDEEFAEEQEEADEEVAQEGPSTNGQEGPASRLSKPDDMEIENEPAKDTSKKQRRRPRTSKVRSPQATFPSGKIKGRPRGSGVGTGAKEVRNIENVSSENEDEVILNSLRSTKVLREELQPPSTLPNMDTAPDDTEERARASFASIMENVDDLIKRLPTKTQANELNKIASGAHLRWASDSEDSRVDDRLLLINRKTSAAFGDLKLPARRKIGSKPAPASSFNQSSKATNWMPPTNEIHHWSQAPRLNSSTLDTQEIAHSPIVSNSVFRALGQMAPSSPAPSSLKKLNVPNGQGFEGYGANRPALQSSQGNYDWTNLIGRGNQTQPPTSQVHDPDHQKPRRPPISPITDQEDHDLALALQLQADEEERRRIETARPRRETKPSQQYIWQEPLTNSNVPASQNGGYLSRGGWRGQGNTNMANTSLEDRGSALQDKEVIVIYDEEISMQPTQSASRPEKGGSTPKKGLDVSLPGTPRLPDTPRLPGTPRSGSFKNPHFQPSSPALSLAKDQSESSQRGSIREQRLDPGLTLKKKNDSFQNPDLRPSSPALSRARDQSVSPQRGTTSGNTSDADLFNTNPIHMYRGLKKAKKRMRSISPLHHPSRSAFSRRSPPPGPSSDTAANSSPAPRPAKRRRN